MLTLRGYDVKQAQEILKFDSKQLELIFGTAAEERPTKIQEELRKWGYGSLRSMATTVFVKPDTKERCLVYFAEKGNTKQVSKDEIATFSDLLMATTAEVGILITTTKLTPSAASEFGALAAGTIFVQHFIDDELLYDPMETVWGSGTHLLSAKETDAFLEDLGGTAPGSPAGEKEKERDRQIQMARLPRMTTVDPVAKYMGARVGQIVELDRESFLPEQLCQESIYYRVIVRAPVDKKKVHVAPAK